MRFNIRVKELFPRKTPILLGILGALITGIAIGTQSTLSTRIGGMIGNFRTGVLMNFAGGIIAGVFVLALTFIQGKSFWNLPASAVVMLLIAGHPDHHQGGGRPEKDFTGLLYSRVRCYNVRRFDWEPLLN